MKLLAESWKVFWIKTHLNLTQEAENMWCAKRMRIVTPKCSITRQSGWKSQVQSMLKTTWQKKHSWT
jgi:hypothetical protein